MDERSATDTIDYHWLRANAVQASRRRRNFLGLRTHLTRETSLRYDIGVMTSVSQPGMVSGGRVGDHL